jgi:hypothetical protein
MRVTNRHVGAGALCVHHVVARQLLRDVLRIMRRLGMLNEARPKDFTICLNCGSKQPGIEVKLENRSNDQP